MSFDKPWQKAVQELAHQVSELIEAHSFDPLLGQVWAALLVAGEPQETAAVAEVLGLEVDEVEDCLQELLELDAVEQEGDLFVAETDPLKVAAAFIRRRELQLVEETVETLRFASDRLKKSQVPQAKQAHQRLRELARNTELIGKVLDKVTQADRLELDKLLKV